jgi:chromosome condensin MukBEF MukE localization factor
MRANRRVKSGASERGNTLREIKHVWKTVDNLTSGAFVKMWQQRVDRYYTRYSETATD